MLFKQNTHNGEPQIHSHSARKILRRKESSVFLLFFRAELTTNCTAAVRSVRQQTVTAQLCSHLFGNKEHMNEV